ncbi:MAG: helix-turn-helix domain-containing protein [Planctomycetota bacterium]|nr:helix-turn-helix domain-containing protein [Planctomycetota bacterium]
MSTRVKNIGKSKKRLVGKIKKALATALTGRASTTEEVADLLDVDRATVLRWCGEGLPHQKRDKQNYYDVAEVQNWMKANGRTGDVGRPPETDPDLVSLKIRKELALVTRYERENAIATGKLIDAAAEQIRDTQKITMVRNRLCGLGATLAPQLEGLDGAERQALIDQSIDDILEEFAGR